MNIAVKSEQADAGTTASFTVSGFFKSESDIERVLKKCLYRGIPRDLIDVAVSVEASAKFFKGRAGANRDGWFSSTGRGALIGLVLSALASLVIVLLPGFNSSTLMAYVQLLGPDLGVVIGAVLGALYGWMKPGQQKVEMLRAGSREDAALLLIHFQPEEEAQRLKTLFEDIGGESILIQKDTARSVGAE